MLRFGFCFAALTICVGALVAGVPHVASRQERRLGFTPDAFRQQQEVERRLARSISPSALSETHRALTRRPHRAGTEGAREVAEYIRQELARAGLEVEVTEYLAYLSEPKQVRIELMGDRPEPLAVMEPPDDRDPDSSHPELDPGFVAYSASGTVTAPVVYANYGLPADYEALRSAGIDVTGRIVLARYGRSHRAVKVYTAERAGAAAVILYSDPADDGSRRGATWPDGLWRPAHLIQRGNAKYSWFWHGDPLTPGTAATRDGPALAPETAPTLPRIPVAVIAGNQAQKILTRMSGAEAPQAFRGALDAAYRLGPGPSVRLQIEMLNDRRPIRNVVGRIRGSSSPDREVILGTHHDAWTFGGIDPGSSAAVILELARRLGALRQAGWVPARSIVFAFWDAEEYGLVGSTEFVEDRARALQERAVVYINSDMYTPGRLVAGGVASLRDFVAELVADLKAAPEGLPFSATPVEELSALGSGADFVAFQDHIGVPTLALEFLFQGGYGFGTYHSSYDSRFYMERLVDPGFAHGTALARLLGTAVMRLAAAPILPFRHGHYARRIRGFLEEAETWNPEAALPPGGTGDLQRLAENVAGRARRLEELIDAELAAGRVPPNAAQINDGLARLEQALLDPSGDATTRWYRHVVYGWNIYSMYDGQPLPGLYEALRVNDREAIGREHERVRDALIRMSQGVEALLAQVAPRVQ